MLAAAFKRKTQRRGGASAKRTVCLLTALFAWAGLIYSVCGQPSAHVVTNLIDGGPGSLREELATAHSGDTISFTVRGTIVLTNGELLVTNNLRITGPGATNLAISANSQSRVLEILPDSMVSLSGLTICDGLAADGSAGTSNSPAGANGSDGGGIYNAGFLTISQCVISNCAAGNGGAGYLIRTYYGSPDATKWTGGMGGNGGGIYNKGRLLLIGSKLASNSSGAAGDGGGAGKYGTAGTSGGDGGALYNAGMVILMECALKQNTAGNGGAGYSLLSAEYVPSDGGLPGGTGGQGGAVCDVGSATTFMFNCEFSFNASGAGAMGTTIWNIFRPGVGGAGGAGGGGGAIWAQGLVRLNGCTFLSNQTGPGAAGGWGGVTAGAGGIGGPGGAICALGELTLTGCLCVSNHSGWGGDGGPTYSGSAGSGGSGGPGGAVYAESALRLNDSIFRHNWAGYGGQGANVTAPRFPAGPGRGGIGGNGGALYCKAELAATNCTFAGNRAGDGGGPGMAGFDPNTSGQSRTSGSHGGEGGGIFGVGALVLHACTVSGNVGGNGSAADGSGPGVQPKFIWYVRYGGPGGAGGTGGIYNEDSLRLLLCTLSGNVGGAGGWGGQSWGGNIYDPPLAGGPGGPGGPGAIYSSTNSGLFLVACTIAANTGGTGGHGGSGGGLGYGERIYAATGGTGGVGGILSTNAAGEASFINTLVGPNIGGVGGVGGNQFGFQGQTGAPDLQGSFSSLGHNLIGQTDGSSGFTNGVNGDLAGSGSAPIDPLLGPLSDNGGPNFTMALLHGSPALDAGDDDLLHGRDALRTDQRGFPRKSGSHVDIGAFEFQFRGRGPHQSAQAPILAAAFSAKGNSQTNTAADSSASVAALEFQLAFSDNTPDATFTVLATTNLSLPLNSWSVLGQPIRIGPGLFQFTDSQATNNPQRFYRVSSP